MLQNKEIPELMQMIAEKSLQLMMTFKDKPSNELPNLLREYIKLLEEFQGIIEALVKNPEAWVQMQAHYWQEALGLWQKQAECWMEGRALATDDPRFNSEEWLKNPFFNLISHQYLLACHHVNTLLEHITFNDPAQGKRLRFFMRNYLDALSPSNFLMTNPELIAETIQSNGKNLLQGLYHFLSDIEMDSHKLVITMTDQSAFTLGLNIAATPGKVIFRNPMMELIQYTPQTAKVYQIPLLIIPPWINKYYILDLSEQNSLVRYLVKQGITVCIISWVNPDANFAAKGFNDYLQEGPKTALEVMKKQLGVTKINTLGFCLGGTLLAVLLAYNKATKDKTINSATFLASLIDFSEPGDLGVYIDEQQIAQLEELMHIKGYLSGKIMASSFNSLKANELIWSFFVKNYLQGKKSIPFDMLYWNADSTNMPATMHSQYLRWMYLENGLVTKNKITLNGVGLDISAIDTPCFFFSTLKDHIAPWTSTYMGFQLMQGPKRFVLGGSGHVAGVINSPLINKYNYRTNEDTKSDAATWLANSTEHPGSWWPEWLGWLRQYSGKKREAPNFEKQPYAILMDAPGSYVLQR